MNIQLTEEYQPGNSVVPSATTAAGWMQPQCFHYVALGGRWGEHHYWQGYNSLLFRAHICICTIY